MLAELLAFSHGRTGGSWALFSIPLSEAFKLGRRSAAGTALPAVAEELPAEELVLLGNSAHTVGRCKRLADQLACAGVARAQPRLHGGHCGRHCGPVAAGAPLAPPLLPPPQCTDAETPVERVCRFQSLLLHNGSLYYVSDGEAEGGGGVGWGGGVGGWRTARPTTWVHTIAQACMQAA